LHQCQSSYVILALSPPFALEFLDKANRTVWLFHRLELTMVLIEPADRSIDREVVLLLFIYPLPARARAVHMNPLLFGNRTYGENAILHPYLRSGAILGLFPHSSNSFLGHG
jgi:hypothetical protein